MKVINSYIFIPKENDIAADHIKLKPLFSHAFEKYFKIDNTKTSKKEVIKNSSRFVKDIEKNIIRGSFNYDGIVVNYKYMSVGGVYYLDIIINNNKDIIVKSLTNINNVFLTNKAFNSNYVPIITYDYVSENYCNILFPLLNKFERLFRKLLFLIFTAQYKDLYFEKSSSEEVLKKAKENLKRKKGIDKEKYRIQNYYYSIDMATLRSYLFDKQWTFIEEQKRKELLNKDLSKLTNEQLKAEISKIEPKSNWDRYFQNKDFSDDIETIMESINELRNLVAHNRIVDENDYSTLKSELEKMIMELNKAINKTESTDFIKIKNEKYTKILIGFRDSLLKIQYDLINSDYISKSIQNISHSLTDASSILQNTVIDSFLNRLNKSKDTEKKE